MKKGQTKWFICVKTGMANTDIRESAKGNWKLKISFIRKVPMFLPF